MFEVGVTERGDPSLDFSWVAKLRPLANIIISKNLTPKLAELLLINRSRCIFHCTCTGWGKSKLEPYVPTYTETYGKVMGLIQCGFPARQIVLRIDPILPIKSSMTMLNHVLYTFRDTGISRVRYSYLDLYPHVLQRFEEAGIELLVTSSFPSSFTRKLYENMFDSYKETYTFESCAEDDAHRVACISQQDLDILGVTEKLDGRKGQRKLCGCPTNKFELLTRTRQCAYGCLYCYWYS